MEHVREGERPAPEDRSQKMLTITVPEPSIRCGHCAGKHTSIADVRACSSRPVSGAPVAASLSRLNDAVMFEIHGLRTELRTLLDVLAVPGGWFRDMMETYLNQPAEKNNAAALRNMVAEARKYPVRAENAPVPAEPARSATAGRKTTPVTEPGMYTLDGKIYSIQSNKLGTALYAKVVTEVETINKKGKKVKTLKLIYAEGMMRYLRAEHRMTADAVIAFNKRHAWCAVCGRHLTKEESVTRGIGPVCAGRI